MRLLDWKLWFCTGCVNREKKSLYRLNVWVRKARQIKSLTVAFSRVQGTMTDRKRERERERGREKERMCVSKSERKGERVRGNVSEKKESNRHGISFLHHQSWNPKASKENDFADPLVPCDHLCCRPSTSCYRLASFSPFSSVPSFTSLRHTENLCTGATTHTRRHVHTRRHTRQKAA